MDGTMSLLQELEESISRGSEESLLRALWHTTDVLITGQYSENQVWVFGQIIERLARDLEIVDQVRSRSGRTGHVEPSRRRGIISSSSQ